MFVRMRDFLARGNKLCKRALMMDLYWLEQPYMDCYIYIYANYFTGVFFSELRMLHNMFAA